MKTMSSRRRRRRRRCRQRYDHKELLPGVFVADPLTVVPSRSQLCGTLVAIGARYGLYHGTGITLYRCNNNTHYYYKYI